MLQSSVFDTPSDILEAFRERPTRALDPEKEILIFGAGNFAGALARVLIKRGCRVRGFIETEPRLREKMGLSIRPWKELKGQDLSCELLLGIFNRGMPLDELKAISMGQGFQSPWMPWEFYDWIGEELGWRFWLSPRLNFLEQSERISQGFDLFEDEESRRNFLRICAFRLGLDESFASFRDEDPQYFNKLTIPFCLEQPVCFVDCGAYTGDTYRFLQSADVRISSAYLFEPDPLNFASLISSIERPSHPVVCLPLGVSGSYDILRFNSGGGEGASLGLEGDSQIAVVSLDGLLRGISVDFLKMDIEGAERMALNGAADLIAHSRPTMAISLYHRQDDLWSLPLLIKSINPGYKLFIRQHEFNSFDSVLYAVDSGRCK